MGTVVENHHVRMGNASSMHLEWNGYVDVVGTLLKTIVITGETSACTVNGELV